jgi:hypothetical protein
VSNIGIAVWLAPADLLGGARLPAIAGIGFEAAVCGGACLAESTGASSLHALRMSPVAVVLGAGDPAPDPAWRGADRLLAGVAAAAESSGGPAGRSIAFPDGRLLAGGGLAPAGWVALDVAAAHAAGQDPAALLRQWAGRCPYVVLRLDGTAPSADEAPAIGGFDAWADLFDAGEEAAVEWYVVVAPPDAPDYLSILAHTHAHLVREA